MFHPKRNKIKRHVASLLEIALWHVDVYVFIYHFAEVCRDKIFDK
jgi:hypothetical protein